jgi:hypothetical protein
MKTQKMNRMLDLDKEMAWITFMHDGWQTKWHQVTDVLGNHLDWSDEIMNHCRKQFNNSDDWVSFGIAPTSQMMMQNSVRDNL